MSRWTAPTLALLSQQLDDEDDPLTQGLLPCDPAVIEDFRKAVNLVVGKPSSLNQARLALDDLNELSYTKMSASKVSATCWRRLYTDTCIFRTLVDFLEPNSPPSERVIRDGVGRLDRAMIISGPCGEGRLDLILELIGQVQEEFLSNAPVPKFRSSRSWEGQVTRVNLPNVKPIPRLEEPPSFSAFMSRYSYEPFILPGFGRDWPALRDHPWNSWEYLRSVAGPARLVPIEIGSDYREDDWSQKMMDFDDFLVAISHAEGQPDAPVLYLAQHSLLSQFPALREDILVPDYVYSGPPPHEDYPQYKPPGNEDQLVLNGWLGPRGTNSPAHTVVGRKTVWLAPPKVTHAMYPYPPPGSSSSDKPHNPASNNTSPSMSNTSRVDVFATEEALRKSFPLYVEHVVPHAMCSTLEAGDLLFFPPGWWHALRSEETSFSVSMWF